MKKVIYFILILCMLLPCAVSVSAKSVTVSVNGERFAFMPHPVIENDKTMVPTNLFLYLNCDVAVQDYYKVVLIRKGDKAVIFQMDNSEYVVYEGSYENFEKKINEQSWTDEEKHTFSVMPHQIDRYGFVPLRELCEELGYTVEWNNEIREAELTCEPIVQLTKSNDAYFVENAIKLLDIKEKEEKGLRAKEGYEAYNFDVLKKSGVIDDNDSEYIKVSDALDVFIKITCDEEDNEYYLEDWYAIDKLEVLDDSVNEELKGKLMNFYNRYDMITVDDILRLDYDAQLTEYDALLFAVRLIGDTYSCTDASEELFYKEKTEVYQKAFEKKLIDSDNCDNADKPILRKEFYEIINRAIFTLYNSGGYSGVSEVRIVDWLLREPAVDNTVVTTEEISPEIIWHEDFSVSWIVPEECKENRYFTSMRAYTESGKHVRGIGSGFFDSISSTEIMEMVVAAYPEKLARIEIEHSKSDYDADTRKEYVFTIDTSNINVVCTGVAPEAGTYVTNKRQWPLQELSLEDGYEFKEGTYYILVSKEHEYRKDEYNNRSFAAFIAPKTANTLDGFGKLGSFGTSYFEEIRLVEATVSSNGTDDFTVTMTPPSESLFEVKER